jgi:hypothetical protein
MEFLTMSNLPYDGHASSRELEPSLFLRDACAVMVFAIRRQRTGSWLLKAATMVKTGRLPR